MAHTQERPKPYHDPHADTTDTDRALERKNRWYFGKQKINGFCEACNGHVLDARQDMTGKLKCKSHFV